MGYARRGFRPGPTFTDTPRTPSICVMSSRRSVRREKLAFTKSTEVMGLSGKPKGFDGGEVERYFREGKIKEIAEYCETDVVGT
jgi:hypothetical protein